MDAHTTKVLEYEKVRALLLAHASCELGRERVRAMAPLTDLREVEQRQAETTEARKLLDDLGGIPLGGIRDVRGAVDRASREGVLQPSELLDIADTLAAARRLKFFLARHRANYPLLAALTVDISDLNALEQEIRSAINDHGEILDNASPELAAIRRSLAERRNRIYRSLESILRGQAQAVQEDVVTFRNGRFV
ncbi:MAG: endonuclease MutS2, partial [Armatimonadota bacterium]|nr:endonuclease MutS2 [Armatimonadota bacterium]